MSNRIYQFACKYISAGFCPIPTWPDKRKNPKLDSLLEYRERLPTVDEWRKWANAWQNANLALLTGYHGCLCALDFDSIGDYNGWYMGCNPKWHDTWTVETGRGRHVYFISDGEPGKDRLFIRDHHEVLLRAKGAYTIAPPSIHHTGKPYRTLVNRPPVNSQLRYILAGWEEKTPVKKVKSASQTLVRKNTAIRPNILDYVQTYRDTPNGKGAYQCFCPFHDDDHPSAWVNPEQNRFGCNSCFPGRWFDVVNVVAMLTGHDNAALMRNLYHRGDILKFQGGYRD